MSKFSYEVFLTVIAQQTFQGAAEVLHVTPSAVSHSINQLEKEMGFPLLVRKRSGIKLTSGGRKVLPYIQSIINMEENLNQTVNDIQELNAGHVRLGGIGSVCINWLPNIIREFHQKYPKINISVKQGTFKEITNWTKLGVIDIGFTFIPINEHLMVYPLIDDPLYCVVPDDFSPENGRTMTSIDLINKKFILQRSDYELDTKRALDYYHVDYRSLQFSVDDQSIISMVESGLGLGILPQLALQKLIGNVKMFPFSKPYQREIALVSDKNQSPAILAMLGTIKQYLAKRYKGKLMWR